MMKKKIMVIGIILSVFGMAFISIANGDDGNIDDINATGKIVLDIVKDLVVE